MDFKIDTKDTYTLIVVQQMPDDWNLSDKLAEIVAELRQNGSKSYIVDLHELSDLDDEAANGLIALHESVYAASQSIVFTGINNRIMTILKGSGADTFLNIAPTLPEATDIINMEILERDLWAEE